MTVRHYQAVTSSARFIANILRLPKYRRLATRVHRVSTLANGNLMRIVRLTRHGPLTCRSNSSLQVFSFTAGSTRNMIRSITVIGYRLERVVREGPFSVIISALPRLPIGVISRHPVSSKRRQRPTI